MDNKCPFYHKLDVAPGILENTLARYVGYLRKVFTILMDSVMRTAIKYRLLLELWHMLM